MADYAPHMRSHCRPALLALAAITLTVGFAADAGSAGQLPYEASITADCNTITGDYDVTVTITNLLDVETAVEDGAYAFVSNGSGPLVTGDTAYTPNPVPAGGVTRTTVSGPGDSGYVEVGFTIVEIEDSDTISLVLAGDCVAIPTTTSSTPQTTSTTAAAAVVAPRFTG
jgi:hypothetical protein